MSLTAALNATQQSIDVFVAKDDGTGNDALDASTFPTVRWKRVGQQQEDHLLEPLTDLGNVDDNWLEGGLFNMFDGYYRIDVPNAAFSEAGVVMFRAEDSDKHMMPVVIQVGAVPTAAENAAATAAALAGLDLEVQSVWDGGTLTIHKGAEISTANANHVDWDASTLPDLTGGTVRFHVTRPSEGTPFIDVALSVVNAGLVTQKIRFTITATESIKVRPPEQCKGIVVYKTSTATEYAPFLEFSVKTRAM